MKTGLTADSGVREETIVRQTYLEEWQKQEEVVFIRYLFIILNREPCTHLFGLFRRLRRTLTALHDVVNSNLSI